MYKFQKYNLITLTYVHIHEIITTINIFRLTNLKSLIDRSSAKQIYPVTHFQRISKQTVCTPYGRLRELFTDDIIKLLKKNYQQNVP